MVYATTYNRVLLLRYVKVTSRLTYIELCDLVLHGEERMH
jgi:hypothetical protein